MGEWWLSHMVYYTFTSLVSFGNNVMAVKYLSFEITGEFITQHARDLVQEGKVREAERFLLTSITGMQHDYMVSILRGNKKMIGSSSDNSLSLADDDPTEMTSVLNHLYAGIVHDTKHYWKPYAQVVGWGPRDVGAGEMYNHPKYDYGSIIPCGGGERLRKFSESRNVAYMNNKQKDIQHNLKINGATSVVLWERVDPPPFWVEVTQGSGWQEGLDKFFEFGNRLSIRDHNSTFGDDFGFLPRSRFNSDENENSEDNGVDGFMGDLLKDAGVPAHAAKGMMQFLSGNEDDSVPVAIANAAIESAYHGYILKDGRFFACEYHNHASLATRLFKHIFNKEVDDPEKEADNAGWIRIQKSALDGRHNVTVSGEMSRQQKATFSFWAGMHGFPEDKVICHG